MKKIITSFILVSICLSCCIESIRKIEDGITQVGSYQALLDSNYFSNKSLSLLNLKGNYGLGTFNDLDGEGIMVEGLIYKIRPNQSPILIDPTSTEKSPFFAVCEFNKPQILELDSIPSFLSLNDFLKSHLDSSENYAIKIETSFNEITIRSVFKQEAPYKSLPKVIQSSSVIKTLSNPTGVAFGYYLNYTPQNINVKGLHFHYINENRLEGGHVLDLKLSKTKIYYQKLKNSFTEIL